MEKDFEIPLWVRIGVKCVLTKPIVFSDRYKPRNYPIINGIYTVRGVQPGWSSNANQFVMTLLLKEIHNPIIRCTTGPETFGKAEQSFRISYFAPLVDTKEENDVEMFRKLLNTKTIDIMEFE